RNRYVAVSVRAYASGPSLSAAARDCDVIHDRAFHHADRLSVQSRTGRTVVSAADRNVDRGVHPLYGTGKYRRKSARTPMDDHVWVRPRAWVRIFIRPKADAAVCGFTLAHLAAVVQFGCGDGPTPRPDPAHPCA